MDTAILSNTLEADTSLVNYLRSLGKLPEVLGGWALMELRWSDITLPLHK